MGVKRYLTVALVCVSWMLALNIFRLLVGHSSILFGELSLQGLGLIFNRILFGGVELRFCFVLFCSHNLNTNPSPDNGLQTFPPRHGPPFVPSAGFPPSMANVDTQKASSLTQSRSSVILQPGFWRQGQEIVPPSKPSSFLLPSASSRRSKAAAHRSRKDFPGVSKL